MMQWEFGWRSCFHDNGGAVLSRVLLGLASQFLCSYITFPLYALVTQMGSHMKKAIFEEETARALKNWHKETKERNKQLKKAELGGDSLLSSSSPSSSPSITGHAATPPPSLHKHRANNGGSLPISPVPDRPSSSSDKGRLSSSQTHGDEPTGQTRRPSIDAESHSIELSFSSMPIN